MTQPTTELLQAINGLAEKADGDNPGAAFDARARLSRKMMANRTTIIAALELKERVENPETVEVVARAICSKDPEVRMGDCEGVVQRRVQQMWKFYVCTSQSAIQALKGPANAE